MSLILKLSEIVAAFAFDLIDVLIEILNRAVFLYPAQRRLRSDVWDAGDVVRCVALEGQTVDKLLRPHSHLLDHRRNVRERIRFYIVHTDMLVEQLEQVLVLRAEQAIVAVASRSLG